MILLASGANTVDVTVAEKATLATPYYYFLFVNDNTGEKFMCYNTYTTVQDYIQRFTITVQASPTWYNGQVALSKYGFYHYYVYEANQIDVISFDYSTFIAADISTYIPTYFTSLVESGKAYLEGGDFTVNEYINATTAKKAYGD